MEKYQETESLRALIRDAESIVIVTHLRPDGDAVGSSSAVAHYLHSIGKRDITIVREPVPQTLAFIDTTFASVPPGEADDAISHADLIICTDFGVFSRSGQACNALEQAQAPKILIDHHPEPETEKFTLCFRSDETSSACEMAYWVIKSLCSNEMQEYELFSGPCGYCLMAGMTTDTNNFANSTYPSTLEMAGELLSHGVDRDDIIFNLYNRYRRNRVEAMSYILSNNLMLREDGLAIIKVSMNDWHRFGLKDGELEGLVNIPLSIDEIKISLYLREDNDNIHVSIRAKRGWSASDIAKRYFNGGGHVLASGGSLKIPQDIQSFEEIDNYLKKVKI